MKTVFKVRVQITKGWKSCAILQKSVYLDVLSSSSFTPLILPPKINVNTPVNRLFPLTLIFFFLSLFYRSALLHSIPWRDHKSFLKGSRNITLMRNLCTDASWVSPACSTQHLFFFFELLLLIITGTTADVYGGLTMCSPV